MTTLFPYQQQRGSRVLFVDDEEPIRACFADTVASHGIGVDTASSAEHALDLVRTHTYEVVAIDLRMPGTSGVTLAELMRPMCPETAFLLVTGAPPVDTNPVPHRFDGVLAKPWDNEALMKSIDHAMALHRKRSERRSPGAVGGPARSLLLLADDDAEALIITKQLQRVRPLTFEVTHMSSLADAEDWLEGASNACEAALVDLNLPGAHHLDTVERLQRIRPNLPIVVLSGNLDEQIAVEALHSGAQDYLVKGKTNGEALYRSIRYAVERKRSEESLSYLAHHDPLTGLGNSLQLREHLARAMARAKRRNGQVIVWFIDLDNFKSINDRFGHDDGDLLLEEIGRRITANVRDSDTVARLGGDEFALVSETTRESEVSAVSERLLRTIREPIQLRNYAVSVTASLGAAIYPTVGPTVAELLKCANSAMYRAKELGRDTYQLMSGAVHAEVLSEMQLQRDLGSALEEDAFVLHYQPQLNLEDGRLRGVEALLRWQHPTKGLLGPGQFISWLEKSSNIIPVGEWILREACAQAKRWHSRVRIGVNLSARQFERGDIVRTVEGVLQESGVDASLIELEITESLLMQDFEKAVRSLSALRRLGCRIAMDDFGAGYSSLSYLKQFPIDVLKIDRSFVTDAPEDPTILRAIVSLGKNLGLEVIAEGVETEEQLRVLGACDGFQGYLAAKPNSPEEIEDELERFRVSGWKSADSLQLAANS